MSSNSSTNTTASTLLPPIIPSDLSISSDLFSSLDTGDIILFNRQCFSMNIYGAFICTSAKIISNSRWDHIGIIIKRDENLFLLEANLTGMKLRPIQERIKYSKAYDIAIRKLNFTRTKEMREKVERFIDQIINKPYKTNIWTLFNASIESPLKLVRQQNALDLESLKKDVIELKSELSKNITSLQRRSLENELSRINYLVKQLDLQLSNKSHFENSHDLSKLFCSELVAALYQHIGILSAIPSASNYTPNSFAEFSRDLPFISGASLGSPVFIRQTIIGDGRHVSEAQILNPKLINTQFVADCMQSSLLSRVTIAPVDSSHEDLFATTTVSRPFVEFAKDTIILRDIINFHDLALKFEVLNLNPGDSVINANAIDDSLYIVLDGEYEVIASSKMYRNLNTLISDESEVCVGLLTKGNAFNSESCLFNKPSNISVRATSGSALKKNNNESNSKPRVLRLSRKKLIDYLATLDDKILERLNIQRINGALTLGDVSFEIPSKHKLSLKGKELLSKVIDSHPVLSVLRSDNPYSGKMREKCLQSFYKLEFGPGENIINQGDRGNYFYVIESGECEAFTQKPDGGVSKICTFTESQTFGEAALLYNSLRGGSVRAKTQVVVWVLCRPAFQFYSGFGSKFLLNFFLRHASIHDGNTSYMTKEDFLNSLHSNQHLTNSLNKDVTEIERINKFLLRLVDRHTNAKYVSFSEFVHFDLMMSTDQMELTILFGLLDTDKNGYIYYDDFCDLMKEHGSYRFNLISNDSFLQSLFGIDGKRRLPFAEFLRVFKAADPNIIDKYFPLLRHDVNLVSHLYSNSLVGDTVVSSPEGSESYQKEHLISGISTAISAAIGRTVVAPLERLRIIKQTNLILSNKFPKKKILSSLLTMYRQDGGRALFRGNGVNVLRIVPALLGEFVIFDNLKKLWAKNKGEILGFKKSGRFNMLELGILGGCSGFIMNTPLYPLEFLRCQLSVTQGPQKITATSLIKNVWSQEGIKGFYRGFWMHMAHVVPYVGINLAVLDKIQPIIKYEFDQSAEMSSKWVIAGGALAAVISQTILYPIDTLRRQIQINSPYSTLVANEYKAKSTKELVLNIWDNKGVKGFFKGLPIAWLKSVPTVGVSIFMHKEFQRYLGKEKSKVEEY